MATAIFLFTFQMPLSNSVFDRLPCVVAAALLALAGATGCAPDDATDQTGTIRASALPPEARETITRIRQGGPFPHERDGTTFFNRERLLPEEPRGYYREFTVATPGASGRGARRIVSGERGELYYTPDHYRSFRRVLQ